MSRPVAVDVAAATALGFDVAELERRIARPIDMPLHWKPTQTAGGEPASGYEPDTRIRARLTSTSVLQHVRPDPAYCDGTTCTLGDSEVPQDSCPERVELSVEAEVETLDGALHATTYGIAVQQRRAASEPLPESLREPYVTLRADLAEVTGRLRLAPQSGAFRYRGALIFEVRLLPDSSEGELSPNVMVEDSEWTGTEYSPLYGSFPPRVDTGASDPVDAGVQIEP